MKLWRKTGKKKKYLLPPQLHLGFFLLPNYTKYKCKRNGKGLISVPPITYQFALEMCRFVFWITTPEFPGHCLGKSERLQPPNANLNTSGFHWLANISVEKFQCSDLGKPHLKTKHTTEVCWICAQSPNIKAYHTSPATGTSANSFHGTNSINTDSTELCSNALFLFLKFSKIPVHNICDS